MNEIFDGVCLCFLVPTAFDWDVTNQQHADRWLRPELNYGCVDFVASAEYMVRPPQPPAYVFVIDTSFQAVQSGMIPVVAEAISNSLENIPNEDGRTKVAVITVDSAVGFYKLSGGEPEMLVVGDLSDIYLPRAPSELLVDLADAKGLVKDLLERTKTMHNATHAATNCLGTALQAARKLLVNWSLLSCIISLLDILILCWAFFFTAPGINRR